MNYLIAIVTAISMATFLGIIAWAWSGARKSANRASALIPFALPEEYASRDAAEGPRHE